MAFFGGSYVACLYTFAVDDIVFEIFSGPESFGAQFSKISQKRMNLRERIWRFLKSKENLRERYYVEKEI